MSLLPDAPLGDTTVVPLDAIVGDAVARNDEVAPHHALDPSVRARTVPMIADDSVIEGAGA